MLSSTVVVLTTKGQPWSHFRSKGLSEGVNHQSPEYLLCPRCCLAHATSIACVTLHSLLKDVNIPHPHLSVESLQVWNTMGKVTEVLHEDFGWPVLSVATLQAGWWVP